MAMEQKFKTGDTVLLRVKVRYVDPDGIGITDNHFCFSDDQFLAVLEPAKAERLTVGDYVIERADPPVPPTPAPKPNPWRVASEPPDDVRNVKVMLDDGAEKYGWHSVENGDWWSYNGEPRKDPRSLIGSRPNTHVIAWREI